MSNNKDKGFDPASVFFNAMGAKRGIILFEKRDGSFHMMATSKSSRSEVAGILQMGEYLNRWKIFQGFSDENQDDLAKRRLAEIEQLMDIDPAADTPLGKRLKALAIDQERYEKEKFPELSNANRRPDEERPVDAKTDSES